MYAVSLTELGWAVVVSAAVLVSGVVLRLLGRWLQRSVSRDFAALVQNVLVGDLAPLQQSIQAMRDEQTVQHGQVRADVLRLGVRLDAVDGRLDRMEQRIYPPAHAAPTPPGEPHVHP
jgi:hypothetical protein